MLSEAGLSRLRLDSLMQQWMHACHMKKAEAVFGHLCNANVFNNNVQTGIAVLTALTKDPHSMVCPASDQQCGTRNPDGTLPPPHFPPLLCTLAKLPGAAPQIQ